LGINIINKFVTNKIIINNNSNNNELTNYSTISQPIGQQKHWESNNAWRRKRRG